MLTTFGWPVQVAVFYLTFQNVHIPSVTLAAFPIQGHSAESSGIWIFSKEFLGTIRNCSIYNAEPTENKQVREV